MIGILNIEKEIKELITETIDMADINNLPSLDGLVVNWIPNSMDSPLLIRQAEIMSHYAGKKIPIFIHDRDMSMSYKEFNWLRKFNVHFFEPAINGRKGFSFLPYWTRILRYEDLKNNDIVTKIGYKGTLVGKLQSFEKYYISHIEEFPRIGILYETEDLKDSKISEYKDKGMEKGIISWNNTAFTIAIGTLKDYRVGYIDKNIFEAMKDNCLPLLPIEHRFYGSMFKDTIVKGISEINFLVDGNITTNIRSVLISEIYERIEMYYPEFTLEYTMDKIKNVIGG